MPDFEVKVNGIKASDLQVGGDHYKSLNIQPSEFIHRNGLNWLEGNAVKYICRHRQKHGKHDIEKAIHYLELLLEWEYGVGTCSKVDQMLERAYVHGEKPF